MIEAMEQIRAGQKRMGEFMLRLKYRLDYHNQSSLQEDELRATDMSLHHSRNSSHPEHFSMGHGAWGMCLIDLIEMLAEEKALLGDKFDAAMLCKRHGIYGQLERVLVNSSKRIGWQAQDHI